MTNGSNIAEPEFKIERVEKGYFKPGVSANPKGRSPGYMTEATVRFMELKDAASKNWQEVLQCLMECIRAKEPWAIQLYFDKLFRLPKNDGEQKAFIGGINATTTEELIAALVNTIPQFGDLTLTEVLECYKVSKGIKDKEAAEAMENSNRVSQDTLIHRLELLNKSIELKTDSELKEV